MKSLIMICTFILLHICVYCADSIIYPAEKVPSPQDYSPIYSSTQTPLVSVKQSEIAESQQPNIYYVSQNALSSGVEYPLEVRKKVLGPILDGYLTNEPIWVLVEIKCLANKWPGDIEIFEHVDPSLNLINCSEFCVIDSINDTYRCNNVIKNYYLVPEDVDILYKKFVRLNYKKSIMYMFCINPRKIGTFSTETIIRIGGNYSSYSDYYKQFNIHVIEPIFDIKADIDKLGYSNGLMPFLEFPKEDSEIRYIVKIEGCNLSKPREEKFEIVNSHNIKILTSPSFSMIFSPSKMENSTDIVIEYNSSGTFSIPGIEVANSTYIFPDRIIEVTYLVHEYIYELTLIILALATIFGPNLTFLKPSFVIIVEPDRSYPRPGSSTETNISIKTLSNKFIRRKYKHAVNLNARLQNSISGISMEFNPPIVSENDNYASILKTNIDNYVAPGDYQIIIEGLGIDGRKNWNVYRLIVKR